jgi:hypothetical protein
MCIYAETYAQQAPRCTPDVKAEEQRVLSQSQSKYISRDLSVPLVPLAEGLDYHSCAMSGIVRSIISKYTCFLLKVMKINDMIVSSDILSGLYKTLTMVM